MITLASCLLWVVGLAVSSCGSVPRTEIGSLHCQYAFKDGSFIGLFSFALGELPAPPGDPAQVDLVYYFDADDCSRGALFASDDEPGSIVPVGVRPRSDLAELKRPTDGAETLAAISPVTNDEEGLAFWIRTRDRGYVLVRLTAVEEASYSDLQSGRTPILKFEWLVPAG
jgi:hypothetical protein